jgi:AAA domain (dynein-related subfamily)
MGNALNLQEINQEEAQNLLRFFLRTNQNLFLFGRRGTGKTELAMQAVQECGFGITYINLSVIERPDLAGYPILNDGYDVVSYKQPHYLAPLKSGEKTSRVLLLDEIDKASPDITAPLLEILQFKTINGKPLNIAGIIATGNLQAENVGSNLISSALLDRAGKYLLQFDFDLWFKWAQTHGIHDLILGFLTTNPELACGEIETTEYSTPSPRGWTLASDAIQQAMKLKLMDVETISGIVAGYVGAAAAHKWKVWFEWFRKWEPIILSMIEGGGCSIDYQTLTPNEQLVFVISACHLTKLRFVQESKTKPKYRVVENLCAFLKENVEPEMQTIGLANSFPIEIVIDKRYNLLNCKPFFDLHSKITDFRNKH